MADLPVSQPLQITLDRQRADDWALALASAGIDSRLEQSASGYTLVVRESDWRRANAVVAAFEAENPPRAAPPSASLSERTSYGALVLAVLLCAFFVVTGPREDAAYWFERGSAVASRIVRGEVWRTVTALTLHADFLHILTNAATLVLFGTSLCGLIGAGSAVWLMLISGAAGNWLTAALRGAPHSAVGASTGIFGGIGGLAVLELMRRRRGAAVSAWRAWAPVAAGLALLGFLGTSPQADVLAHLFGFAVGALLGVSAFELQSLRDRRGLQLALCAAAAVVVVVCWWLALA